MDSAQEIARDMLNAINVDGNGFLGAVAKGIISFPVSMAYLGYDFMDTEHRRENQDDKYRLARLIENVTFNDETIYIVINPLLMNAIQKSLLRFVHTPLVSYEF